MADVSIRRSQSLRIKPGEAFKWSFGKAKGEGVAAADGLVTLPGRKSTARPTTLAITG